MYDCSGTVEGAWDSRPIKQSGNTNIEHNSVTGTKMNEIDQTKFNRLEQHGERMQQKLKDLISKQIKIFAKMGVSNCYTEIISLKL